MLKKDNIKFDHISLEEGLSQSVVSCIVQDYIGFMWFGTQDGLNRYDGNKFKVYKNDSENINSLCNNFIKCLYEDGNNDLWIGTQNGLCKYDRDNDCFINYNLDFNNSDNSSNNNISAILKDNSGNLWIGTNGGGLINFDEEGRNNFVYQKTDNELSCINDNRISAITEDTTGNLWIGTWGGGLNLFDRKSKNFIRSRLSNDEQNNISIRRINSLYIDSEEILYICTNNGIYKHNRNKKEFTHFQNDPSDQFSLSDNLVSQIFEDSSHRYWIGTREGGLNIFDPSSGKFITFKFNKEDRFSISNNTIMSIYEDKSGIIWIGTFGGGVCKFKTQTKKIYHYFCDPANPDSLCSNDVCCFCEDTDNNLWIGTRDNGINKFDRGKNNFVHFKHNAKDSNSISHNDVMSIIQDDIGNIWIGTSGYGMDKFDICEQKIYHYKKNNENKNSIGHDTIFSLAKDKNGIIWIGSSGGGLNKFDTIEEKFTHYIHDPAKENSISSNRVRTILIDSEGIVWIGTDNGGLNKFDKKREKFYHYKNNPNDISSISENGIITIFEDASGFLWIGTMNNGLNKFDKEKGIFKRYREKDGLPNDSVSGIEEDSEGNLWISTNNGISKFNPKTETFKNYNTKDGFQSNEFNPGAFLKLKSGELSFGGINGFNIFNPVEIRDNSFIPPIVISDFQIFNKPVKISEKNSPLKRSVIVENDIILSYEDSVFTFEFASLDFNIPDKNQYAYKMEGFDKEWIYSGYRRFATYTNLDPGEYYFRVKGSNNDGVWNEDGTKIKIKITPPFWKTWWFRTLGIITTAGAARGIYQNKLNQVRKEKKAQEEFTKRLIDVQESDRKKISEELHHSIGHDLLITKNKLLLSVRKPDDKEYLLQNINDVSSIISDTLKDIREIAYSLHPYQIERLGLSKAIKSIIDRASKSSDIKYISNIDYIDKLISSEFEISLYRIIQECINNIVKHSQAKEVILNINKGRDDISILISDDGIGFSPEKVKANYDKHGFGLSAMSERIKIFKGKFQIESSSGNGTSININIPLKYP